MSVMERPSPSFSLQAYYEDAAFRAIEAAAADLGLRAVSVAEIVKRGHMARGTFYKVFDSKEDCARRAVCHAGAEVLARIRSASVGADQPVEAGLAAVLRLCDEKPNRARFLLVEGRATEALTSRYEAAMGMLIDMLRKALPHELPSIHEMVVGGVAELLYQQLLRGLPCTAIEAELTEFVLRPFR